MENFIIKDLFFFVRHAYHLLSQRKKSVCVQFRNPRVLKGIIEALLQKKNYSQVLIFFFVHCVPHIMYDVHALSFT